jgi:hypothetical protein
VNKDKQFLKGKKGEDPDWIRDISSQFFAYKNNSKEYKRELRELYIIYLNGGLNPKDAIEKAKKTLDSFQFKK